MLNESGITEQQWRILRILSESGPQDASSLADRACILQPSMMRISRSIIDRGLIERETNGQNRRFYTVSTAAGGQKTTDDDLPRASEIAAGYRDKLCNERFEFLLDLLQELERP